MLILWLKQKNNFLPKATKKKKMVQALLCIQKQSAKQNNCFPLFISILQLRKFISEEQNISSFIYVVTLMPGLSLKNNSNNNFYFPAIASSFHLGLLKPIS